MKWIETTLRKGTSHPVVCRDMYIEHKHKSGEYFLYRFKNSKLVWKRTLKPFEVEPMIKEHELIATPHPFTKDRSQYRTKAGTGICDCVWEGLK